MSRRREVPPDLLQALTPHILRLANGSGATTGGGIAHTPYVTQSQLLSTGYGFVAGTELQGTLAMPETWQAVSLTGTTAAGTANLTCGTAVADVPGASVVLDNAGTWLVIGVFQVNMQTGGTINWAQGYLDVGGTVQTAEVGVLTPANTRIVHQPSQTWIVATGGTAITAKLTGKKTDDSGTVTMYSGKTTLTVIRLA